MRCRYNFYLILFMLFTLPVCFFDFQKSAWLQASHTYVHLV